MNPKESLQDIIHQNDLITQALSQYLNLHPRFITPEMVEDLARECGLNTEESFLVLFSAACGLDTANERTHRALERDYLRTGVKHRDPNLYRADEYYRTVRLSHTQSGRWQLCEMSYAPFEPFVCGHPILCPSFREIPQIGYFTEEFRFPAVLENGVEWMTVTPNEIETMKQPIENSHGRVLTLGLGLGYFAFCASQKSDVQSVTVIERDSDVISLFREQILPQFPNADKIQILRADAIDYMEQLQADSFDYCFADLWHDASDGLDVYIRLKRIERKRGLQNIDYWIEPSLLSYLRRMVYEKLTDPTAPLRLQNMQIEEILSDNFLRSLASDMHRM